MSIAGGVSWEEVGSVNIYILESLRAAFRVLEASLFQAPCLLMCLIILVLPSAEGLKCTTKAAIIEQRDVLSTGQYRPGLVMFLLRCIPGRLIEDSRGRNTPEQVIARLQHGSPNCLSLCVTERGRLEGFLILGVPYLCSGSWPTIGGSCALSSAAVQMS